MKSSSWILGLMLLVAGMSHAHRSSAHELTLEDRSSPFKLSATPLFGPTATVTNGDWFEVVAHIESVDSTAHRGFLEITSPVEGRHPSTSLVSRAPFHVAPQQSIVVHLPVHGTFDDNVESRLELTAYNDDRKVLGRILLPIPSAAAAVPLLIEVQDPARVAATLRNSVTSIGWDPFSYSPRQTTTLAVGSPSVNARTGDFVLPEYAGGYASVTAVLIPSDKLVRVQGTEREALCDWIAGGGALAVAITRPDDLRDPLLSALTGGGITEGPAPKLLFTLPSGSKAPESEPRPHLPTPSQIEPDDEEPSNEQRPLQFAPPSSAPSPYQQLRYRPWRSDWIKTRATPIPKRSTAGPAAAVLGKLVGYTGGRLTASAFGATAPYGLGEVHLLAFDPNDANTIEDPWVQGRIVMLVEHAWEQRARDVFVQGVAPHTARWESVNSAMRRTLDPNENFRPALAASTLILVLYSVIIGPLVYFASRKKNRPMLPMRWIPVVSIVAFALIGVTGVVGRGWHGQARRLSLIEMGTGTTRASIRRYRGLFRRQAHASIVPASDRTCLLDTLDDEVFGKPPKALEFSRDHATLRHVKSLPSQTVVVQEDGFIALEGECTFAPSADGWTVTNNTGHALGDALIRIPRFGIFYAPELPAGASTRTDQLRLIVSEAVDSLATSTGGGRTVHILNADDLGRIIGGSTGQLIDEMWTPLGTVAGRFVDWFPDDTPVILGTLKGGENVSHDSGLTVHRETTLIRIVGSERPTP